MNLGFSTTIHMPFDEALDRVKDALKEQGFGVVSEIDVKATFKQKLDVDFRPYTILGACNPGMAKKAIEAMPEVGLLLPCNVTVEEIDGGVKVTAVNPDAMLSVAPAHPEIAAVAADAKPRLQKAIEALGA